MSWPVASRKFEFVSPPRAYGPTGGTGPAGQVVAALVSAVPQYLNLQLVTQANRVYDASVDGLAGQNRNGPGVVNNYVTLYADGCDLGIVLGPTAFSVGGATGAAFSPTGVATGGVTGALPDLSAKGTVTPSGIYNAATGACWRIPSGTKERFLMQPGQDLFLGVVGSATGTLRLYQSSPDNA